MKFLLRAALLAALPWSAGAADRAPLTVEDLVALERVSDPKLSPDGTTVAYAVETADRANNRYVSAIWVADVATAKHRPVTAATSNATTPRWGPGGELYFLSDRSGSEQVWRFDMRGGEAQQVTNLPRDVITYVLSRDGQRIALSMDVFRDCGSDVGCTAQRFAKAEAKKETGMLYDRLFVRHWDTWRDGTRAQLFTARIADGRAGPVTLVSGALDGDVPTKPDGDSSQITFTPDGTQVLFTMRVAGFEEAWSTNLDLWIANSDGSGEVQGLTTGNPAMDTQPLVTPGGEAFVWLGMSQPGYEADRARILIREFGSRQSREIAPGWDRSPQEIALSPDGRTVYAVADDLGQTRLFAIDVADGKVTPLTGDGGVTGLSVGPAGIVVAHNTLDRPDDLFFMGPRDRAFEPITRHNAEVLARTKMAAFEPFTFQGANDETVHGYVVKPAKFESGKKYPVAFVVHGGPQVTMLNQWFYRWNAQVFAGMGYGVVVIDFHGSTGYGQAFTDSIAGDWGGKPLDDLQKGWVAAARQFKWLDGGNACALGASYGGYLMNWIEGNWHVFECLVNHDGDFDIAFSAYASDEVWYSDWSMSGMPHDRPEAYQRHNPANTVDRWQTPMLVIHGDLDYRVGIDQSIATFTALQKRGIVSQFLRFPDEGHWVLKPNNVVQWYRTVGGWLDRHLKGPPPDPPESK
ncbi:MAG TPA: S9 family peptidase [Nevskiaceae bacterium]|nr:S9 family peptidase [Nevskiaceae bacterium]